MWEYAVVVLDVKVVNRRLAGEVGFFFSSRQKGCACGAWQPRVLRKQTSRSLALKLSTARKEASQHATTIRLETCNHDKVQLETVRARIKNRFYVIEYSIQSDVGRLKWSRRES